MTTGFNTEKIVCYVMRVPERRWRGQKNAIWRNNDQNVSKLDENYNPTDARAQVRINTR